MTGGVGAVLAARLSRLDPARRVATVTLSPVGRGRSFAGAYVGASGQLAPVTALGTSRKVGRLVTVRPSAAGAELDLIIGDDEVWHSLAAGVASIDVQVWFVGGVGGDPTGGHPVRVEIG